MYAIVLAGGYATRLWPLTKNTPKALLPIAGKPLLDYIIEKLQAFNPPLNRIILSTNLLFQNQFESWLNLTEYKNIDLVPDKASCETEKPGAIKAMSEIICQNPEDDVLIIAGDGMFHDNLEGLLQEFDKKKRSIVAVYDVGTLEDAKRCATVEVAHNGEILGFIEKPSEPKTKRVCGAVYLLKKGVKSQIRTYVALGLPTDQPGKFIEWLCHQEPVYGYMLHDPLWDIGTHEAYRACNEYFGKYTIKEVCKK